MSDREIEQAVEAFKRLLQQNRDIQFGSIEGTIQKGHIKELTLHREEVGIRNGEIVTFESTDY